MKSRQLIANRYTVGKRIGQGGMGTVYMGRDTITDTPVALKELSADIGTDEYQEALTRFAREGEVLRQLDHPNIVKVLATFEDNERQYIVMELVTGGSLADLLNRKQRLSVDVVLAIALELSDALTRAHHLQIIHRDIKPANVLLAENDTPRLTDFGIAHIAGQRRVTESGHIVGTLSYISPELLRAQPPGTHSDIWALGIMLFEMLTGFRPFDQPSPVATIQAIINKRLPDLEALRPDVSVSLVDLIYRMLDKSLDQRIPTMRLIGAELEAVKLGYSPFSSPAHVYVAADEDAVPPPVEAAEDEDVPSTRIRQQEAEAAAAAAAVQGNALPLTRMDLRSQVHNLPRLSTPFIGREQEISELILLLDDPDTVLVTITGPGGMGKTRLGLRVAEALTHKFANGVYFVPLAGLEAPEHIVTAIAESLRLNFAERQSPREQVLNYLEGKEMLLVLDNFEHLMDGVDLVQDIVSECAGVRLLVTSRIKLNLRGENLYTIAGIDYEADTLEQARLLPAVQLFEQSARRSQPGFDVTNHNLPAIVDVCSVVQGMPLAIELAAAWVEMLDVAEISQEISQSLDFLETELRDMPERHRSVRAVFDYSWQLLSEEERTIFTHLSVFRGGFNRHAAQQVSQAGLRQLAGLVNKSLMRRHGDGRYEVHEVLRQYAEEELAKDPVARDVVLDRHMHYYAEFLSHQEKHLKGGRQQEAARAVEREQQNIRLAWQRALTVGDFDAVRNSLESLNRFYDMMTFFEEGEHAFRGAVTALRPQAQTPEQQLVVGQLLARQGWFTRRLKTAEESRQITQQSLDMLHIINERAETAFPLNTLGCLARDERDHQEAMGLVGESLEVYRETGDQWGIGFTLFGLGDSAREMDDFDTAKRYLEESAQVCKAIGDLNGVAWAYVRLGQVAIRQDRYEAARTHFLESLSVARKMGVGSWVLFEGLQRLGWLEWRYLDDYAVAIDHLEEAHTIIRERGHRQQHASIHIDLGLVNASRDDLRSALRHFREAYRLNTGGESTREDVRLVVAVAHPLALSPASSQENQVLAVEWLACAVHHPAITHDIKSLADETLSAMHSVLPAVMYDAALARGQNTELRSLLTVVWESLQGG